MFHVKQKGSSQTGAAAPPPFQRQNFFSPQGRPPVASASPGHFLTSAAPPFPPGNVKSCAPLFTLSTSYPQGTRTIFSRFPSGFFPHFSTKAPSPLPWLSAGIGGKRQAPHRDFEKRKIFGPVCVAYFVETHPDAEIPGRKKNSTSYPHPIPSEYLPSFSP